MGEPACRACRGRAGHLVLDLGEQPACDYFPRSDDPGPDPVYPLQMWLCAVCGLAQLVADPTVPEEPRGAEPPRSSRRRPTPWGGSPRRGCCRAAAGSPSTAARTAAPGWSCWPAAGSRRSADGEPADVVLDCFGLMHAADQSAALAERAARVAAGGVLLLQYHSLDTIIRCGQWNALRHGHYAYYSTTALAAMLAAHGFSPRMAWQFELYGGTVLLAAGRDWPSLRTPASQADGAVRSLLAEDARVGVRDPAVLGGLQRSAHARAERTARLAGRRAVRREHRARLRRRLARGRPAAPGGRGSHAAARGRRRLAGQAGPADAGDRHPGRQPGTARRAPAGRRPAVPRRTCWPRSARRFPRSRRLAADG